MVDGAAPEIGEQAQVKTFPPSALRLGSYCIEKYKILPNSS